MRILITLIATLILLGCSTGDDSGSTETETETTETETNETWTKPTEFGASGFKSFRSVGSNGSNGSVAMDVKLPCIDEDAVDPGFMERINFNRTACLKEHEALENSHGYVRFSQDADSTTDHHAVYDDSDQLHYLDRVPERPQGFSNERMIKIIDNSAVYKSAGSVYKKDLSTDEETLMFSGNVSRFYPIMKANGWNWLAIGDQVIFHKANGESYRIEELEGKQAFAISDGIVYSFGGKVKYGLVDDLGNTTLGHRSNKIEWDLWLAGGSEGAAPVEVSSISVSGVMGDSFLTRNGLIYEKQSVELDFKLVNMSFFSQYLKSEVTADIKSCDINGIFYTFGKVSPEYNPFLWPDGWYKLSMIDKDNGIGRVILNGSHDVHELQCGANHLLLACATNRSTGDKETVIVENANTDYFSITYQAGCDGITQSPQ